MAWPDLVASDLETRVRTYLNEVTADFFTQAEIWRWLSVAAKDIAQKTLCVRRIVDAVTANTTRNVTTSAYKVLHVEYVPSSGRAIMLTKIDPLRVGHFPQITVGTNGAPVYWYEFGGAIGIDPIPDGVYNLRLYISDMPKMCIGAYPLTNTQFTSWATGGTGFTAATATHTGAVAGTLTENTSLLAVSTNYTVSFTLSTIGSFSATTIALGDTAGATMTTAGVHTQNITTSATASPKVIFMATGDVTFANLYILKEADFGTSTDQTELPCAWQHLLALYATHGGLTKDRKYGPAQMLESIYNNELAYLRQAIVENIPDGRSDLKYM